MDRQVIYRFPILDFKIIVDSLNDYNIDIRPIQLKEPTHEFMFDTCSAIINKLTSMSVETLAPVAESAMQKLEILHPELHSNSTTKRLMISQITKSAQAADFADFSTRDIAAPTPQRAAILFSAFINFMAHCQSQINVVQGVRDDAFRAQDRRDAAVKKTAQTHAEVLKLREVRAKEAAELKRITDDHAMHVPEIVALVSERGELEKELASLKDKRNQTAEREAEVVEELRSLQERLEGTRARIVQSPDRIRTNIAVMSNRVADARKTVNANEMKQRDLQAKLKAFESIEKDVRSCIEQLKIIERESAALADMQKALQDLRDSRDKASGQQNAIVLELNTLALQRENAQERLKIVNLQAKEKEAVQVKALARLREDQTSLTTQRRENEIEVGQLMAEAGGLEQQMNDEMLTVQAELNELLTAWWALRAQAGTYMQVMQEKLGLAPIDGLDELMR